MQDITEIIPFGKQEPEMSKLTKQLYVIVQYNNPLKKINFKDFIYKIKEYIEIYDFDWTCKHENGRRCYPRYDKKECAKDWPKRYDYKGAYRTFAKHMNRENNTDLLLLEQTLRDYDIRHLFIIAQSILEEIEALPKEPKHEYRRKASMETYKLIMDEIRERLQIQNETDTTQETHSIPTNPEQESQYIRDIWTKKALKDVTPR